MTINEELICNSTKVRHTFTQCDCGKEVCAFICFHKDGKVYWNNKCPDHKLDAKKLSDWPEMPKNELDKYLRSIV